MSELKQPGASDADIGEIECTVCAHPAAVRRGKSAKYPLYIHCYGCGTELANSARRQRYILDHATFYKPQDKPPAPKPAPRPAPKPAAPPPADDDDDEDVVTALRNWWNSDDDDD